MVTAKSKKASKTNGAALAPPATGISRGEREAAKRARKLRRQTSADEQKLWHQLRDKQLDGFRFRRQRSIGKYIVDFVCDDAKLIIELTDKPAEASPSEKARAAYFKAQGYLVLHMLNNEVSANIKTGLESIRKHLKADVAEVVTEVVKKAKRAVQSKVVAAPDIDGTEETTATLKKPAAKKPAAKKPVAKKAAAEKPAAKKLTAKKVVESDE